MEIGAVGEQLREEWPGKRKLTAAFHLRSNERLIG